MRLLDHYMHLITKCPITLMRHPDHYMHLIKSVRLLHLLFFVFKIRNFYIEIEHLVQKVQIYLLFLKIIFKYLNSF